MAASDILVRFDYSIDDVENLVDQNVSLNQRNRLSEYLLFLIIPRKCDNILQYIISMNV